MSVGDNLAETKTALRRELRAQAARYSSADRAEASQQICQQIRQHRNWKEAKGVLFFVPLPQEPDIQPLMDEAFAEGKLVAVPRYSAPHQQYIPCEIDGNASICKGPHGVGEAAASCPPADTNKLDLFLIPGIGFSLNGRRLGRGKGHYDRLLADVRGLKCGVAFDWQVTVEIPVERHDIVLNCIVTPTRWHIVAG